MSTSSIRIHSSSADDACVVPTVRVVVVDDVLIGAVALADVLQREEWVGEVSATTNAAAPVTEASDRSATVIVINAAVTQAPPAVCTLAHVWNYVCFGVDNDPLAVTTLLETGARGIVLRSDTLEALLQAIVGVASGRIVCSDAASDLLIEGLKLQALRRENARRARAAVAVLTSREYELLRLIEAGLTNREIAERLTLEIRTVKNHVHNILQKLAVSRRQDAVARLRLDEAAEPGPQLLLSSEAGLVNQARTTPVP